MTTGQQFTEKYLDVMFSSLKDATPEEVQEELEHCRNINKKPVRVPRYFRDFFSETSFLASNDFRMQVLSTKPYDANEILVLYIHGGACIYQPVFFHWRFIHDLAIRTHIPVIMPIYPKYPDSTCVDNINVLLEFYERDLMQRPIKKIVLIL